MNIFTLKHRIANFEEELNQMDKDNAVNVYDENEGEVKRNRYAFLVDQVSTLNRQLDDKRWEAAVGNFIAK